MPYTYLFDLFNNSDDSLVTGWTGVSVTGLMLNVTGLPQATEYYYKIKQKYTSIYGTEIISAYSDRRDVTTLNFNDTITNLNGTINSINYESFVFNFNRYPLPTYRITVAQDGLPLSNYTGVLVTGTTFAITGLTNNLQYDVSVNISYNALEEVETYTQIIPTLLPPSSVATSGSPLATEFTASWTNASGITQDLFYLSDDNFATYIISGQVITGDNFSITGLTANTSYKYALRSYLNGLYGIQESTLSSIVEVTTASAGSAPAPTYVVASGTITNTSIGEIFLNPIFEATGYITEISSNNFVTGTTYFGNPITITGLAENTSYKMRSKTVNEFGESAYSSEESFKTKIEMILYASNRDTRYYIYTTNQSKSFDTKLTSNTSFVEATDVKGDISKSGRYFTYIANTNDVYIHDFSTGISTRLTNNASTYSCPRFKGFDENYIYFLDRTSTNTISRVNISTLAIEVMRTFVGQLPDFNFSYDGNTLYASPFISSVYNLAKTDVSVDWVQSFTILQASAGASFYEYIQSDNTKIVYTKYNAPNYVINDANLNGTSITQRTSSASSKDAIVLSPNGDKILYTSLSGSDRPIIIADRAYNVGTGYFDNPVDFYNTSGNYNEYALAWGLVQLP